MQFYQGCNILLCHLHAPVLILLKALDSFLQLGKNKVFERALKSLITNLLLLSIAWYSNIIFILVFGIPGRSLSSQGSGS